MTTRERNEIIYEIRVEDIFLTAESLGRGEDELTPGVIERVIHKIEAMDFGNMADTINIMIDDAIEEIEGEILSERREEE